jgi:tetratricopeptide (TPR) repeat protein
LASPRSSPSSLGAAGRERGCSGGHAIDWSRPAPLGPCTTSGTPLLNHPTHAAAAHLLLAEVRDEQGGDLDERIALLERSVALAPDWVSNRQDLAWAYSEAGRQADATAQLNHAIGAVRAADPSWSIRQREFEESISGRAAAGTVERLREDLRELTT